MSTLQFFRVWRIRYHVQNYRNLGSISMSGAVRISNQTRNHPSYIWSYRSVLGSLFSACTWGGSHWEKWHRWSQHGSYLLHLKIHIYIYMCVWARAAQWILKLNYKAWIILWIVQCIDCYILPYTKLIVFSLDVPRMSIMRSGGSATYPNKKRKPIISIYFECPFSKKYIVLSAFQNVLCHVLCRVKSVWIIVIITIQSSQFLLLFPFPIFIKDLRHINNSYICNSKTLKEVSAFSNFVLSVFSNLSSFASFLDLDLACFSNFW